MTGKPLKSAVLLYLALGASGGLLLSGYVFWAEFRDAMVLGVPNQAFCTPVPGDGGDIPIAGSAYSCRIAGEYLLLTLFYPPTIVIFWTSLFATLLTGATWLWWRLARVFGAGPKSLVAGTAIPPARLAMGVYGISVLCLGIAGQMSGGWFLLGPFALVSWPALLAPLLLFPTARYLRLQLRNAKPA